LSCFRKLRGKKSIFICRGWCVQALIGWGVKYTFSVRHRTARPDPTTIRRKVGTCTGSLDLPNMRTPKLRELSWNRSHQQRLPTKLPRLA
jgi:hypothetical protein